ncbi:MAG: hypothetical protein ACKVS6_11890 [Planctomycetota bacterium]
MQNILHKSMLAMRKLLVTGAAMAAVGMLASKSFAHDYYMLVNGKTLILHPVHVLDGEIDRIYVPVGGKVDIFVKDAAVCAAALTATKVAGGTVFNVSADPATSQIVWKYTLTHASVGPGAGTLKIHVDGDGPGCPEVSDNFFLVTVVDQKTAEKEWKDQLKQQNIDIKNKIKLANSQFNADQSGILAQVPGSSSTQLVTLASNLFDSFDNALFDIEEGVRLEVNNTRVAGNQILSNNGFTGDGISLPFAFTVDNCSLLSLEMNKINAEVVKGQASLNKTICKGIATITKANPNVEMSVHTNNIAVNIASGPGDDPENQKAPACDFVIRSVKCVHDKTFNVRIITVKGRADVAQGATVTVTINGPKTNGVPAYTSGAQQVTVGSDCKWELVYQDASITPGTGTVDATHPQGAATSTYTCN